MTEIPFHPLANLFPLIEGADFADLVADVRQHGLREPVVVYEGHILDGRNRYRACKAAGVPVRTVAYEGDDALRFVVSLNLRRRHLTESQRASVAAKLANMPRGRPIEDKDTNLGLYPQKVAPDVPIAVAAEMMNVSPSSVDQAKVVHAQGIPELAAKLDAGQIAVSVAAEIARAPAEQQREILGESDKKAISKTANKLKRERKQKVQAQRRAAIVQAAATVPAQAERYQIHHAACVDALSLPAQSVDWIITDPPYPAEYLPVYDDLARVAEHVLKPGGLAVVMVGQTYLPEIMASLNRHLTYHWTAAYLTPGGQAVQQFARKVNTFWKPVLIYSAGQSSAGWIGDVAKSDANDNDKTHHEWGQSGSGMRDLMRRFVKPGDTVLDPFLGGGTTMVIGLELGCSVIGYDTDAKAIETTKARIGGHHAADAA